MNWPSALKGDVGGRLTSNFQSKMKKNMSNGLPVTWFPNSSETKIDFGANLEADFFHFCHADLAQMRSGWTLVNHSMFHYHQKFEGRQSLKTCHGSLS